MQRAGPLSTRPSTRRLTAWFHPSTFVSPLQSTFVRSSAHPFRGGRACQGFCPLRDVTGTRLLTARHPKPRYVPSTGVRSLSTVSSACRLRGLFHPRAASRARPVQGLLSPHRAHRFVSAGCLLAVVTPELAEPCGIGGHSGACLGLEASICAEARARDDGDQPPLRSLPSSGSGSSRLTTPRPRIWFPRFARSWRSRAPAFACAIASTTAPPAS